MPDRFSRHLEPLLPDLYRWCRASSRDPADAEDVLQDAVLRAFRDFERFSEGTSFRAYVFTYLAHEMLNRNRAFLRRKRREQSIEGAASRSVASVAMIAKEEVVHERILQDPQSALESCDDQLRSAFRELRPEDQVIFLLRSVGELTCREIAESLRRPLGTVLGTLYRVRIKLRRRLIKLAEDRGIPSQETLS